MADMNNDNYSAHDLKMLQLELLKNKSQQIEFKLSDKSLGQGKILKLKGKQLRLSHKISQLEAMASQHDGKKRNLEKMRSKAEMISARLEQDDIDSSSQEKLKAKHAKILGKIKVAQTGGTVHQFGRFGRGHGGRHPQHHWTRRIACIEAKLLQVETARDKLKSKGGGSSEKLRQLEAKAALLTSRLAAVKARSEEQGGQEPTIEGVHHHAFSKGFAKGVAFGKGFGKGFVCGKGKGFGTGEAHWLDEKDVEEAADAQWLGEGWHHPGKGKGGKGLHGKGEGGKGHHHHGKGKGHHGKGKGKGKGHGKGKGKGHFVPEYSPHFDRELTAQLGAPDADAYVTPAAASADEVLPNGAAAATPEAEPVLADQDAVQSFLDVNEDADLAQAIALSLRFDADLSSDSSDSEDDDYDFP